MRVVPCAGPPIFRAAAAASSPRARRQETQRAAGAPRVPRAAAPAVRAARARRQETQRAAGTTYCPTIDIKFCEAGREVRVVPCAGAPPSAARCWPLPCVPPGPAARRLTRRRRTPSAARCWPAAVRAARARRRRLNAPQVQPTVYYRHKVREELGVKCEWCRAQAHPECRALLPLPCVPPGPAARRLNAPQVQPTVYYRHKVREAGVKCEWCRAQAHPQCRALLPLPCVPPGPAARRLNAPQVQPTVYYRHKVREAGREVRVGAVRRRTRVPRAAGRCRACRPGPPPGDSTRRRYNLLSTIDIKFAKLGVKCEWCRAQAHPVPRAAAAAVRAARARRQETQRAAGRLHIGLRAVDPPDGSGATGPLYKRGGEEGLMEKGIYRISATDKDVKRLKERFLRGCGSPSLGGEDVHVLCGCIKDFLRGLREPLVTSALWADFLEAARLAQPDATAALVQGPSASCRSPTATRSPSSCCTCRSEHPDPPPLPAALLPLLH
ncbi:unnamed protein product [Arctia plantaginis]|uniref:Rho-GAP domain-containing protein n=1 Tax=Arctia plantaginis TaxID=874455 RepID=A0A8S1BMW1_ARCPL|nr:unnamed protein product [Arctia plantaginis]